MIGIWWVQEMCQFDCNENAWIEFSESMWGFIRWVQEINFSEWVYMMGYGK